jgi:hypothetical protein
VVVTGAGRDRRPPAVPAPRRAVTFGGAAPAWSGAATTLVGTGPEPAAGSASRGLASTATTPSMVAALNPAARIRLA